jgi:predicted amidohydrolase YtcJ
MIRCFTALFLSLLCGPLAAATLVYNVNGYTMDDGKRISFRGLEFDNGVVTRLHSTDESAAASKAATRIDGEGATLLPGLIDAHGHVASLGKSLKTVNMAGSTSEADAVARVKAFIEANPDQEWVSGRGWNQVLWPGKQFPDRASLDAVSGDRALWFSRIDGHAIWANSKALELAGIGPDTPDPAGGQIIRDDTGRATGVLIDNAKKLVFDVAPPLSDALVADYVVTAMQELARLGVTSAHDSGMSNIKGAGLSAQEVRVYQRLRRDGEMHIRIYGMLSVLDPANDEYLRQGPLIDPEHMLDIRSIKIQADGALGSRGAALFEDYSDMPGQKGLLLVNDEQLDRHMDRAMAAGYQVNIHAIGDKANDRVLDFMEAMIRKHDNRALRHRNEHSQIIRLEDIPRFAEIGVVASIQPTHATSDMNMAGDRLGEARLAGAYAWRKLLDSGAHLAGGSDFPVESANPFFGLHAAVTRQDHQNQPPGGWLPSEKLTREETLSLFTEWAAWAAHQEDVIGRLTPGYAADFILVRDDYFEMPAENIWKNKVLGTWVSGRRVFQAPNLSPVSK